MCPPPKYCHDLDCLCGTNFDVMVLDVLAIEQLAKSGDISPMSKECEAALQEREQVLDEATQQVQDDQEEADFLINRLFLSLDVEPQECIDDGQPSDNLGSPCAVAKLHYHHHLPCCQHHNRVMSTVHKLANHLSRKKSRSRSD